MRMYSVPTRRARQQQAQVVTRAARQRAVLAVYMAELHLRQLFTEIPPNPEATTLLQQILTDLARLPDVLVNGVDASVSVDTPEDAPEWPVSEPLMIVPGQASVMDDDTQPVTRSRRRFPFRRLHWPKRLRFPFRRLRGGEP